MIHNTVINDTYDRISKILKNDQKFPNDTIGKLIVEYVNGVDESDYYYDKYPPLLDIVELSGSLEHEGIAYQKEVIAQIHYKMQQLRKLLPDIH
jgi:hypothetical protein